MKRLKRLLCYIGLHHLFMRYMPNGRASGATHVILVCGRKGCGAARFECTL